MGNNETERDNVPIDESGESALRGPALDGPEQKKSVAHTAFEKRVNPDEILRLDNEEDTLYDDGLELDDDPAPLTGKDGRDDSE